MEILFIIISLLIASVIATLVTSIQAKEIGICRNLKLVQGDLLVGKLGIEDISDELLLRLRIPKFTHIGVGGVGPAYTPSFVLWCMVGDELKRRRGLSVSGVACGGRTCDELGLVLWEY